MKAWKRSANASISRANVISCDASMERSVKYRELVVKLALLLPQKFEKFQAHDSKTPWLTPQVVCPVNFRSKILNFFWFTSQLLHIYTVTRVANTDYMYSVSCSSKFLTKKIAVKKEEIFRYAYLKKKKETSQLRSNLKSPPFVVSLQQICPQLRNSQISLHDNEHKFVLRKRRM